jgi:7-cyano-7-deazaguanine reductase
MAKPTPQLGRPTAIPAAPDQAVLDRVRNPHPNTNYLGRFTFPEFVMCPVTGQPDYRHSSCRRAARLSWGRSR